MNDIGSSKTLMGIALAVATISELPVFFFSDRMIARFGGFGLVLLALIASGGRALVYSVIQTPWLVLPVQMAQGLTFSALWVGGVSHAKQLAPAGMGSTAQGLFAGLVFGLGAALGGLSGGALYESLGASGMFRWTGIGLLVGLAILSLPLKTAEPRAYLR
jgi:MFS family permease